jgi:osmotically-inducible protein OsmY
MLALFPGSLVAAGEQMTDVEITQAIETELLFDQAVQSNRIHVVTLEGVVSLSGTADNMLARERAARIASTVKGVRSVVNRIAVAPAEERTDVQIRKDILGALLSDPATDSYEVSVSVRDGLVRLSGSVDSWKERELAAIVAKSVRGVTGLENSIDVIWTSRRSDLEIQHDVEQALRWNSLIPNDTLIDVEVEDGTVRLSGTVGSAAEHSLVLSEAWVTGVRSVDGDALQVKLWARNNDLQRVDPATPTDSMIQDAVRDALLFDPRVDTTGINVSVRDSTVRLTGTVDHLRARRAAAEDARRTVGVHRVKNYLKVDFDDLPEDPEIAAEVRRALARNPYVDSFDVTVNVSGGAVYLNGDVDTYFEKARADDVVARIPGVLSVHNYLDVERANEPLVYDPYLDPYTFYDAPWYDDSAMRSRTFKPDWSIEEDIRSQLAWSPFVDADQVAVDVDDGVATLTGIVDSWLEYGAAMGNAYQGGAVWVDNDLTVVR